MEQDTKKLTTPFLRYRHGNPLLVKPNVRTAINEFVTAYKQEGLSLAKGLTKDIDDGSGLGVHADSTWNKAIHELFNIYREFEDPAKREIYDAILSILEKLSEDKPMKILWDEILPMLSEKLEVLSGWKFSHLSVNHFGGEVQRDTDGTYFVIENGRKTGIIGTKTLEENKFGFISEDIQRDYGRVNLFLKLIELLAVSLDFVEEGSHYRKELAYVLSESDNNTWFLHGQWRVQGPYELIPITWHPRSCYCDIQWLRSEAISALAAACKVEKSIVPQLAPEGDSLTNFENAFGDYPLQLDIGLETNILLGSDFGKETPAEVYVDFEGKKLRWINGTKQLYPTLIVPTKDPTYEEVYQLVQRFINSLIFSEKHPIKILASAGCPKRFQPLLRQPRLSVFMGISRDILPLLDRKWSKKELTALSFYKEGINSSSPYSKFLGLYKVITLAFLNSDGAEDTNAVVQWVNNQVSSLRVDEKFSQELHRQKVTLGNYLRHQGGRNALAHVGMLSEGNFPTIEPDNLKDRHKIEDVLPIVQELADRIIERGMLS